MLDSDCLGESLASKSLEIALDRLRLNLTKIGKRFANTLHELDKAREEIHRLQEDNKKLLSASKSWCAKYQEIAFKHLDDTDSYTQSTPLKPLKIQDVDDLLNL
jgi:hypothetical protein